MLNAALTGGLLALLCAGTVFADPAAPALAVTAPGEDAEVPGPDVRKRDKAGQSESERALFTFGHAATSNADASDLARTFVQFRNHRRPWFWPWQDARTRDLDLGLDLERVDGDIAQADFRSERAMLRGGRYGRASGIYGELAIGTRRIDSRGRERRITPWEALFLFGLNAPLQLELRGAHDLLGTGASGHGAALLTVDDTTAAMRWRPARRLRLSGVFDYRSLSDGNSSLMADASLLFGISPDWPWIWAGIGGQYLDFERQALGYWSPRRYTAVGPRFESSFALTAALSATAAANGNWIHENGTESTGTFVSLGLEYQFTNRHYLRLDYTRGESLQNRNRWWEEQLMLRLSGALF